VDRDVDRLIYSSLVKFVSAAMLFTIWPVWGVSADATVYNFELKPDVIWHDGEPLTAEDVIFTIELMRNGVATSLLTSGFLV